MKKNVLITGICGQDGAYLAEFLLKKKYNVYGVYRRTSSHGLWRLEKLNILNKVKLVDSDVTEFNSLFKIIKKIKPKIIFNLAAQSFVQSSFNNPIYTSQVNSIGVLNILEIIRILNLNTKFYQASTSEMFGNSNNTSQNEGTIFYPRSPYGVSKVFSHYMVRNYRESYGIEAYSGVLFNHESPLRGNEFVTKKITKELTKYFKHKKNILKLGNIYSKRDWGYAKEYIECMYKIVMQNKEFEFVIGTGKTHTVKDFINKCLKYLKINYKWEGSGLNERCIDISNGRVFIKIDKNFYRPAEVDYLKADISKAKNILKWSPKTNLEKLAKIMIDFDLSN